MNPNTKIATAVAAILGSAAMSHSATAATVPLTAAQSAAVSFYLAGSSAAKNAVLGALQVNLCGGTANALTFASSGNTNFTAFACQPAAGVAGANGTDYYAIYYRTEGGSVVGALPIANKDAVNQLNLSAVTTADCPSAFTCAPVVGGTSAANGINDSFTGPVSTQLVNFGILDVEPAALVGKNYPSAYLTTTWGPINPAGVAALSKTRLFDEVYGIYVNTGSNAVFTNNGTAVSATNPLALSKETVNAILTKGVTNWTAVSDVSGNAVTTTSLPIVIVNREAGSGSRAATDLLITGDTCTPSGTFLKESTAGNVDYFATGDVLGAAGTVPGAVTYATIENTKTNMSLVSLNGIVPSSLTAATGQYDFWVEATGVVNPNIVLTTAQTNLLTFLTSSLGAIATAPHLVDVVAIPGLYGNVASVSPVSTASTAASSVLGTATIYVNRFTRNGSTCALPAY